MSQNGLNIVLYKLYSNLGIQNKPHRQRERNDGVYYAPDAVVSPEYVQKLPNARIFEFRFPKNDTIKSSDFFATIARESERCTTEIRSRCGPSDTLIAVGGDNSITLPAMLADIKRFGAGSMGVITFDAHGDIHLRATSPSDNFHGMYMRPFFDTFDIIEIERLVPRKLTGADIMYIGNSDFEKEEIDFVERMNIERYPLSMLRSNADPVVDALQRFLDAHAHVHINFDIDVFDISLVSATGMPSTHGLFRQDVFPLLKRIARHRSKTLSLSEINPEKEGGRETTQLARQVIDALVAS